MLDFQLLLPILTIFKCFHGIPVQIGLAGLGRTQLMVRRKAKNASPPLLPHHWPSCQKLVCFSWPLTELDIIREDESCPLTDLRMSDYWPNLIFVKLPSKHIFHLYAHSEMAEHWSLIWRNASYILKFKKTEWKRTHTCYHHGPWSETGETIKRDPYFSMILKI